MTRILLRESVTIDENVFCAIISASFGTEEESSLDFLRSLSSSKCVRCGSYKEMCHFLTVKEEVRFHCAHCRKEQLISEIPRKIYFVAWLDNVYGVSALFRDQHKRNFKTALSLSIPVECCFLSGNSFCEDMSQRSSFERDIVNVIEDVEKFKYIVNKKRHCSLSFFCSQRERYRPEKRPRVTKKSEPCGGSVNISYSGALKLPITVRHNSMHERAQKSCKLSDDSRSLIQRLAREGHTPFMICSQVRTTVQPFLKYDDIYNCWLESAAGEFRRHVNPKESALLLARDSQHLKVFWTQSEPFGLAILTDLAQNIAAEQEIIEAFIDSTYKTNSSGIELFAVLASVLGTGFPIAYVLLESRATQAHPDVPRRKDAIMAVLGQLYRTLPGFRPIFFFSDKNSAQLSAIRSIYGLNPSICMWHMKRAVKQKLNALNKEKKCSLSLTDEGALLNLITDHFNRPPLFDKNLKDVPSCRVNVVNEVREFLQERHEDDLEQYLMVTRYQEDMYCMWGGGMNVTVRYLKQQ